LLKPVQASSYTFRSIIEGGYLYVDKTQYLYQLVKGTIGIYFLARPRRFGKSLTISTLEEIFRGNKELFRGLWLYESDYSWQKHPVLRIDFGRVPAKSADELQSRISRHIQRIARDYGVTLEDGPFDLLFDELIVKLAEERQVVVLIDEYDKPILDNIDNLPEAIRIRDTLKQFYTVLKSLDQYIRFVFITGISKFSKVGVFSGLNNLDDLTTDVRFATAFGITTAELRDYFHEHIAQFSQKEGITPAQMLEKIREWYNGFCFVGGEESVYNPFSTLQLFNKQRFSNYWFETGTPSFLIKLLKQQHYPIEDLQALQVRELAFNTYEIENLSIIPLLFQTGYLTIKDYDPGRQIYTLSYPNMEVEDAFLTWLLSAFNERERSLNENHLWKMIDALEANKLDRFFAILDVFFANIPCTIQLQDEKYYQSLFFLIFKLIGFRTDAEVCTNQGRIDCVIECPNHIYIFEFKLNKSAAEALTQIIDTEYYRKYRLKTKPLTLVGVNFDSSQRKVSEWQEQSDDLAAGVV
jgi:hypothetical protein